MKKGEAKVAENAKPPRTLCNNPTPSPDVVPPNPPRNGATHAKLNIEKVKATAQFQKDTAALDHQNKQADKRIELDLLKEMIKAKGAKS